MKSNEILIALGEGKAIGSKCWDLDCYIYLDVENDALKDESGNTISDVSNAFNEDDSFITTMGMPWSEAKKLMYEGHILSADGQEEKFRYSGEENCYWDQYETSYEEYELENYRFRLDGQNDTVFEIC